MPIILFILAGTVHSNTSWLTGPPLLLQTAALEVFPPGALMMLTLVLFSQWMAVKMDTQIYITLRKCLISLVIC